MLAYICVKIDKFIGFLLGEKQNPHAPLNVTQRFYWMYTIIVFVGWIAINEFSDWSGIAFIVSFVWLIWMLGILQED